MRHNRVFGLFRTPSAPAITFCPDFLAWYPRDDLTTMRAIADFYGTYVTDQIAALPVGRRVVQARWIMHYESKPEAPFNADPLPVFENGGYNVQRNIRMMRPFGRILRERKQFIDGIFINNEGSFGIFALTPDQMQAVFRSPKARAKMPPVFQNTRPEQLTWGHPEFNRDMGIKWDRWNKLLMVKAMRAIFIESGIFNIPRRSGPPVNPVVCNFNWSQTVWPVMDNNGWPILPVAAIDYKTSSPGLYFTTGGRYHWRNHHELWNTIVDHINMARSCMAKSDAQFWPTIVQPERIHPWAYEMMVAHIVRTGANWTTSRSAWIYFNEHEYLRPTSDPMLVDIIRRHDQPFPRITNLPPLELDCDRIETAGYVTTYEDFLANVEPPTIADPDPLTMGPMQVMPSMPRAAAA